MGDETASQTETCRILIIGAQRARVAKVVSLLHQKDGPDWCPLEAPAFPPHLRNKGLSEQICVEYLPCVAVFGSYQDESGNSVRYLESVDYYGPEGNLLSPTSLLTIFDEEGDHNENKKLFCGVAGVAIGGGIEGKEDTARIQTFLESMVSVRSDARMPKLRTMQPSAPYETMQQELVAYKSLSTEEKNRVTRQQTMGPGKMAKVARDLALELIQEALLDRYGGDESSLPEQSPALPVDDEPDTVKAAAVTQSTLPHVIDTARYYFKCRMCRAALFGEADLEDPPHEPSQHSFSHRKLHHDGSSRSATSDSACQSYFLQDTLAWMGDEGRFNCPTCDAKLGSTTWSGAQCSCGTWVVPAIQIPKSKVDAIVPGSSGLPAETVIHRLAKLNVPTSPP